MSRKPKITVGTFRARLTEPSEAWKTARPNAMLLRMSREADTLGDEILESMGDLAGPRPAGPRELAL